MSEYLNITGFSIGYLLVVIAIFIYTIRNRLDILCISAVCYVVYSMYCIFGYGISGLYRPHLSPQLYGLVYLQMFLILGFTMIVRRKDKTRYLQNKAADDHQEDDGSQRRILTNAFYIYTFIIVLFALVNVVPIGFVGFAAGKQNVWNQTNILYIISLYGAYPSFAYGLHTKNKLIWIPSMLVELTIFFAGSRAFTATLIIILLCERGVTLWKKQKGNIGIFILGASAVVFLLFYRMVDRAIMQGDMDTVLQTLSDPAAWLEALEFNEPRVIIANYDYVLTSGIQLPAGDILYRFLDFVPGLTSLIPIELKYPEYFSTWLMDQVAASAGVGGTIWGESFAMFGTFGVVLFTLLWLFLLRFSNNHLDYHRPYSSFIIALGTYLAWYINRLDFNRVGQSFKVTVFCFLIWACIYLVLGGELQFGKKIRIKLSGQVLRYLNVIWSKTGKRVLGFLKKTG